MNFFEEATLRLKQELGVSEDREVAVTLGMAPNAWSMRKRRGAFPDEAVWALAAQRKGFDANYVLHGVRPGQEHTTGAAQALRMKSLAVELAGRLYMRGVMLPGSHFGQLIDEFFGRWSAANPDYPALSADIDKALDGFAPRKGSN